MDKSNILVFEKPEVKKETLTESELKKLMGTDMDIYKRESGSIKRK